MRLLSPAGVAGIAVLAVDAVADAAVLDALRVPGSGQALPMLEPGGPPRRAELVDDGRALDDVLVLRRADSVLEVHVHGSPAVLAALDARFGVEVSTACAPAERLLREALSVEQFEFAAEQLAAAGFEAELQRLRALPGTERPAAVRLARRRAEVAAALQTPRRLVLVGRQNAGKSSLFNRLLFRERALTGAVPGLTRDPIAEVTTLAGYPYELVDTAGEGDVGSALDEAAIRSGRALRGGAVVLLVVDGSQRCGAIEQALLPLADLVVRSKTDLTPVPWPATMRCDLEVSAQQESAATVRARFGDALSRLRGLPPAGVVGGPAPLDEAARRALFALDDDCSGAAGSA